MASTTSRTIEAKFDGDTTGLAAAAKRAERIVEKAGDDTGKSFDRGFGKWFRGRGGNQFGDLGKLGGRIFGAGILSGFATPGIGPILLVSLLAVVAAVMPAVGAAAAGAFILAFGLGLAGIGLVFAAQSEKVKAAFSDLAADLKASMRLISEPFEATWLSIAETARRVFAGFAPLLAFAFIEMAGPIADFANDVGDAFLELKPVIDPVVDAFNTLLDKFGEALPNMFENLATGIIAVADSIADNPDSFVTLIKWLFALAAGALIFIGYLNTLAGWIGDVASVSQHLAGVFLGPVRTAVAAVQTALGLLSDAWDRVSDIFSSVHTAKLSADGGVFYSVLAGVVAAAVRWAGRSFKATLGATVDVFQALAAAESIGRRWAGRVFSATLRAVPQGFGSGVLSGLIPGRAVGGPVAAGGTYLVGERGPEILTMGPAGGHVTPNHELGNAGGVTEIHNHIEIGGEVVRTVITTISDHDRRLKRAVSAGAPRVV